VNERVDELKGDVKQGLGKITGNERLEAEGKAEHDVAKAKREAKGAANQVKGSVKQEIGKLRTRHVITDAFQSNPGRGSRA